MTSRLAFDRGPRRARALAAVMVAIALVAGCGSSPASQAPPASSAPSPPGASGPPAATGAAVERGGTLRVVVPAAQGAEALSDPGESFLDPQVGMGPGDFGGSWELQRCCLARTLYSHNGRSVEEGGARLQPDIAAALPEVSADGLTWTIPLRDGLHYGPPLEDVEITARDFVRSLHRLLAAGVYEASWFAWEFSDIEGAAAYTAGEAASITGLEAPDDHTLVINLTAPAGGLGARLAEPASAPVPPDPLHPDAPFGIAEGADGGYGRFLISSGPYMLEGSEALDFSVPAADRAAVAGIASGRLTLVRNPSWDPASDELRPAYADRIEITPVETIEDALAAIDAGTADLVWPVGGNVPSIPAAVYAALKGDPQRGLVHVDGGGVVRNVITNVAAPPFDDIHVRKALNYAIDKQHLVDLQGGAVGSVATGHLVPDYLEDGLLVDYDPYATPGHRGDLAAARAEMRQSRYDTNGDGLCDLPACEHVRAATREPYDEVTRAVAGDLEALGINLDVEVLPRDDFFGLSSDPRAKVPLFVGLGYKSNHIAGAPWLLQFDGRVAIADDWGNTWLVGATPEQLSSWGYETTEVPNVDERMAACQPLVGAAQFQCVASADQYLMENVVPMVPYSQDRYAAITSPRVLTYGFDELTGVTALDQLALAP
jgi:ABC-type transport system substrate-binding protein